MGVCFGKSNYKGCNKTMQQRKFYRSGYTAILLLIFYLADLTQAV